MRRVLVAIALTLTLLVASLPSPARADTSDAGIPSSVEPVASAPAEGLPARLGKALVFAVVVSAFLLAGGMWRRGRRKGRPKRQG